MDVDKDPEADKERVRAWAIRNKSPYHCVKHGTYVGANHSLYPKEDDCVLGRDYA